MSELTSTKPKSSLKYRWITALVAVPLIVLMLKIGGIPFAILVGVSASMLLWEFYMLGKAKELSPHTITGIVVLLIHATITYLGSQAMRLQGLGLSLVSSAGLFIFYIVATMIGELWRKRTNPIENVAFTVFGTAYIGIFFCCLISIREMYHYVNILESPSIVPSLLPDGIAVRVMPDWGGPFLICLFFSIWACDSIAYFIGKKFGKTKLWARISPKKSWEGSVAGLFGAVIFFIGLMHYLLPTFSLQNGVIIGLIVGIIGPLGDLTESLFKRDAGIKDSSSILPGHGGMLDRFDSMLLIVPIVYIYLLLTYLVANPGFIYFFNK
jgi:phosphatidate cytidylyltransferase